ncbi:hypothetical protein [Inconstantimicrobium mannanitabidum]|uniref:Uncharacterized protein n=2 Tax=Inconstantimicrobium mannanitabidum TaxID=1604901 RepID=A0ACB5RJM5_9CLOT|nr:hypothetical protein [Clostridium sp. TW13]GKX68347.1 hypothetical protein rsdtw13_36050 [Clostridium sp. TW13]GKX68965.1 hypothetical protein rsdtw13_42230 [Clostridium sp. TW13]
MEITYSNTYEDLIDMYKFRYLNDKSNKKSLTFGKILTLLIIMLSSFIIALLIFESSVYVYYISICISIFCVLFAYKSNFNFYKLRANHNISNILKQLDYSNLLNPITLTLTEESIKKERNGSIDIITWNHVQVIENYKNKIYLRFKNNDEVIIPEDTFKDKGETKLFLEFINSHVITAS